MRQILLFSIVLIVFTNAIDLQSYSFQSYEYEHGKFYTEGERFMRQMIFENNLRDIIQHNSNPHRSYDKGINQFTDRTPAELQVMNGYRKDMAKLHRSSSDAKIYQNKGIKLPTSFDWRNSNPSVLTSVKDQGHCGSCWTFSAASAIESHWAIATGQLWSLSEQQIASCTVNDLHCGGTGGCQGGIVQLAFESVQQQGGLASEWTYPYSSYQGTNFQCGSSTQTPAVAQLSGYTNIKTNSYSDLIEALYTQGPISVSVDAKTWHSYAGGVHDGCNTMTPDINHGVLLVGYGVDPQFGPYWTLRNSWGPKWGEQGYIRIRRTGDNLYCGVDITPQHGTSCDGDPSEVYVCGMCGILFDNCFPNVSV